MVATFHDWSRALIAEMVRLGVSGSTGGGALIDAAIPFRLEWSPARAARTLLHLDRGDYLLLLLAARESGLIPGPERQEDTSR